MKLFSTLILFAYSGISSCSGMSKNRMDNKDKKQEYKQKRRSSISPKGGVSSKRKKTKSRTSTESYKKADKGGKSTVDSQEDRIALYKKITEQAKEHAEKMKERARYYKGTELSKCYSDLSKDAERAALDAEKDEKSYMDFINRRKSNI